MESTNLNIRIEKDVKIKAEKLFDALGLNMTSAVNIFLRQAIRENGIPFEIKINTPNETTLAAIQEGKAIVRDKNLRGYNNMEDLRAALESWNMKLNSLRNSKKIWNLQKKQGKDTEKLYEVIEKLANGEPLEEKYRDHYLSGDYKGCRECHIEPDWLLIYEIVDDILILMLYRVGSHSDLF